MMKEQPQKRRQSERLKKQMLNNTDGQQMLIAF